MGNYEELKQAISSVIKTNGNQKITGQIMQNALLTIISTIGDNATFAGIATPDTNPGTPDQNVFWIATKNGEYVNFDAQVIYNESSLFVNENGSWVKKSLGIPNNMVNYISGSEKFFTDSRFVNAAINKAIIQSDISTIKVNYGTRNDVLFTINGIKSFYYKDNIPNHFAVSINEGLNSLIFINKDFVNNIISNNQGKVNIEEEGNVLPNLDNGELFVFEETNSMVSSNKAINNIIKKMYVSDNSVNNIEVILGSNNDINFLLKSDNTLKKEFYISKFNDVDNIIANSYNDEFFIIELDKEYINYLYDGIIMRFYGTLNENVYNDKQFEKTLLYYWGSDFSINSGVGGEIYANENYFHANVFIEDITFNLKEDGLIDIYLINKDRSNAKLFFSIDGKKGIGKYEVGKIIPKNCTLGFLGNVLTASPNKYKYKLVTYKNDLTFKDVASANYVSINVEMSYRYIIKDENKDLFSDVTFSVLSDSISTFGEEYSYSNPYYPKFDINNFYQTWWGRLISDGMKILKNQSVSQSTVTNISQEEYKYRWIGYSKRIENLGDLGGNKPDIIFVQIGVNDMYLTTLGEFDYSKKIEQMDKLDTYQFKQAYQYIVYKLLTLYPNSKIFLCTPFKPGNTKWGFPEYNSDKNLYFKELLNAIRELSDSLGVGLIDFYKETKINYITMKGLTYKDPTHPGRIGHYLYYKIAKNNLINYLRG
jgi:hypothetical protein